MSVIAVTIKHGRTLDDARAQLRSTVAELQAKFGGMVQRADWAADGNAVKVWGKGFDIDLRLDPQDLHVAGNLTFLGGLLGGPFAAAFKQLIQKKFPKRLP